MKLVYIVLLISITISKVKGEYTAAVVEFYPEQNKSLEPEERLSKNVNGYLKILDEIGKDNKFDIVVFPEMTLSTNAITPHRDDIFPYTVEIDDKSKETLCKPQNTTYLTALACAAQEMKTYLVINLYERARCNDLKNCSKNDWDFYNTNVVFDRDGSVISKYRKYNLFGEYYMNRTSTADISIFETDFGETFASFICFDILFKEPTLDLITKYNVTNIIYPSMWFSELPFLTALQTQMQWAYAVNATLLASGANDPARGSGGSGIYQGTKGALVLDILGNTDSKAFVVKVTGNNGPLLKENDEDIDIKAKQMDGFYFKTDHLKPFTSKIIEVGENRINDRVCHEDFCCAFEILLEWNNEIRDKNYYVYHMVAYSGVRSFTGVYNGGIEICGVVACMEPKLESCGKRFPNYDNVTWPATFNHIQIKAEFQEDEKKVQYPNSLLSNIKPLPVDAIEWTSTTSNTTIERTYTLKKPQNRLMTFAIYGRDFNRDSPPSNNSSDRLTFKLSCLVVLIALNMYL